MHCFAEHLCTSGSEMHHKEKHCQVPAAAQQRDKNPLCKWIKDYNSYGMVTIRLIQEKGENYLNYIYHPAIKLLGLL